MNRLKKLLAQFVIWVMITGAVNGAIIAAEAGLPKVWIYTDMSDPTLPGTNHRGTVNDPDDVSAMAGYLLMSNRFETLGIVVASTHRVEHAKSPDQAVWANRIFGDAYQADVRNLESLNGFSRDIRFLQSCLKQSGERFSPSSHYGSLDNYNTVKSLFDTAEPLPEGEVINVLCWGSLTEPAILVAHCLTTDNTSLLKKLRFIAHWTNSSFHQGTPEHPEDVANCREDAEACRYMKSIAAAGKIEFYECGAIGQHGIVSGSPKGNVYFDQFRSSRLGTLFVDGKYVKDCVDHSDSATYWVLLGDYGVNLKDIAADGSNPATVEQANEQKFRAASQQIHDELLLRSRIASGQSPSEQEPNANTSNVHCMSLPSVDQSVKRPNVLFIAMDDLNDWISCLGGHPQTITPNLDRLAASGVLFTNAHCPAPACNPSRSAIFTGRAPNRSGLYDNRQQMREIMPDEPLIPQYFRQHGYRAAGSGKLLHYFIDANSWDEYYPEASTENPLPETYYPKVRPVSLPVGGPWQYVETDWAALDVTDEEFGGDWSVSKWVGEQLTQKHDKPFFLGCGIYRPHEPWFVPKKYIEPFPLDSIQLPPGYKENDLEDVPPAGVRAAKNRYFAHIQQQNQWRQGVQGYLASIHFADAMLGRVLDALESGPNADNTIVVLWSDHGWQLGEKEHWQKYTGWRAVTRVPLIVRVPKAMSSRIPAGTEAGGVCDAPVNLLSLFPTLVEMCDLPAKESCDGPSLVPLLQNVRADWPHHSVTYLATPGSFSISGKTHRYIHYGDGGEELYDIHTDPWEWTNLAELNESASLLTGFRNSSPQEFATRIDPSVESLGKLAWHAASDGPTPPSKPDGSPFKVYFKNQRNVDVELFWMDPNGTAKLYGTIAAGAERSQQTRPGAVWMVQEKEAKTPAGHFIVGDRTAQAIIPVETTPNVHECSNDPTAQHPNVLLILVDDLKPALGCYGDPIAKTPHIDALAGRGMRFDLAYCNQAVCAPSRFTLLLGSHSTSTGLYGLGSELRQIIPDAVTMPQYFAKHGGYRTESLGKVFHIGHGNHGDPDSFSVPHFHDKVIEYLDPASTDGGQLTREEAYFSNRKLGEINSLPRGSAFESPDVSDDQYADGRVAAETVKRLQAAKGRRDNDGIPFFITAGFARPHLPFSAPKKYWDLYDPATLPMPQFENLPAGAPLIAGKRGGEIANYKPVPEDRDAIYSVELKRNLIHGYYASTSFVDAQIGKVLDELDRLQLADNTIVVLWGDHGFHLGDLGIWTKHTNYEQANRIPILVAAPGVTTPGSSTRQLAESVDIFPTLAELAGLPAPNGPHPIDGLSLVPVLKNPAERVRDHAFHAYPKKQLGRAIRTERYRLVEWKARGGETEAEYELYDYEADPYETRNLAASRPDVVAMLRQTLAKYPPPVPF